MNAQQVAVKTRDDFRGAVRGGGSSQTSAWMSCSAFAPVYPASEELTVKKLRELVGKALEHARDFPDYLPAAVKEEAGLPLRADALMALHRPRDGEEAERGRRRLAFDELLVLQVGLARRRRDREQYLAPALSRPGKLVRRYREVYE